MQRGKKKSVDGGEEKLGAGDFGKEGTSDRIESASQSISLILFNAKLFLKEFSYLL